MDGRNGHVKSVFWRVRWDRSLDEQLLREVTGAHGDFKEFDVRQQSKPLRGSRLIAGAGLAQHELRRNQTERPATFVPPVARHLLVRSNEQVTAWPSGQVANDRRGHVRDRGEATRWSRRT